MGILDIGIFKNNFNKQNNNSHIQNKNSEIHKNHTEIKENKPQLITYSKPSSLSRSSQQDIRARIEKEFGKADQFGEYRISNHKALVKAKKATTNTVKLRSALSTNSVNFNEKERKILALILKKQS